MDNDTHFFPVPLGTTECGITAYDWLAAVAMQALLTKGMEVQADRAMTQTDKNHEIADRAYTMADAMLLSREKALAQRRKVKPAITPSPGGARGTRVPTGR